MKRAVSLAVTIIFLLSSVVLFASGTGEAQKGKEATQPAPKKVYQLAYIDGLLGPWAELVGKGAVDSFKNNPNFSIKVMQVQKSGDVLQTVELVESAVSQKVDGILMLVFTSEALMETLSKARKAGIVFGTVGTKLATPKFAPEAPDFVVGGVNYPPARNLAVKAIEEKLHGKGNVVIINGLEGSDVSDDRKRGYEEACAKYPGIKVLFSDYVGFLDDTAYDTMSDLLVKNKKIDLALCATDPAAKGAYEAAKAAGREKEIFFTGWDLYDWYADLMKTNPQFYGSVAALPYFMGSVAGQLLGAAVSNPEFMRIELDCEYPVVTKETLSQYPAIH